jgi:hypothetical protein
VQDSDSDEHVLGVSVERSLGAIERIKDKQMAAMMKQMTVPMFTPHRLQK